MYFLLYTKLIIVCKKDQTKYHRKSIINKYNTNKVKRYKLKLVQYLYGFKSS